MTIHKKIAASLKSLSGEDRAAELEARLQHNRRARPSQEERQRELEARHKEEGRDKVYNRFLAESRELVERPLRNRPGMTYSEWADRKKEGIDLGRSAEARLSGVTGDSRVMERDVHAAIATRTGVLSLDHNLGGGLPSGFVEIYGPESVGKTTLLSKIMAAAQGMGKQVMMTSTEFFDGPYFAKNGVDLSKLLTVRSDEGHIVLEAAYQLIKNIPNMVYVIDSATGLRPPNDEYDYWVAMLWEWIEAVSDVMDAGSCVIIVDQVRAKKSVSPHKFFASGTDSVARKIAGSFSTRLALSRTEVQDTSYDMVVNIMANTLKAPSKIFTLPVTKGNGIDVCRDLVRVASAVGVVEQSGSWYRWGGDTLGQGEEQAARYLEGASWARGCVEEETLRTLVRGEGP